MEYKYEKSTNMVNCFANFVNKNHLRVDKETRDIYNDKKKKNIYIYLFNKN